MYGTAEIKKYRWYIIPLIALIVMNIVVITIGYYSYKDETVRLGRILAETRTDEITFEEADGILGKYGYVNQGQSSIYRQFIKLSGILVLSSAAVYIFIVLSLKRQRIESGRKYLEVLAAIENNIELLREGKYDASKTALRGDINFDDADHIIARLDTLLDGLRSSILITKEKAEVDRRETKDVVTDISHQLKTPLAAIKSTYEIMQNADLTDEERDEIETLMGVQITSLEKLILSLVNISRLESGMIDIRFTEGSLFDSILEAVNSIWLKADEKNISIEFDNCEEENLADIMLDRKWLVEAFINILDNAVKYSEENTVISISVINLNFMARIEFKDQGIGIPADEKHKVFKRFYRGSSEEVSEEKGSGVGLYLARYIISEHSGTIMVKDNIIDGKKAGSIFVVHLPLKK